MLPQWHLGHHAPFHPTYHGFSTFFGLPYSGDLGCIDSTPQSCLSSDLVGLNRSVSQPACPALCNQSVPGGDNQASIPLYNSTAAYCSGHTSCDDDILESPFQPVPLNQRYAERALRIIDRSSRADKPFFLYIGLADTHTPLGYSAQFEGTSARAGSAAVFGNTLADADDAIGQIVGAVDDDTLVLITADNGPADLATVPCFAIGDTAPFLGSWQRSTLGGGGGATSKTTTWEGGHHMIGLAFWRNTITEGRVTTVPVSTLDFLPTLLALTGASLPGDRSFDGIDLSPILLAGDEDEVRSARQALFFPDGSGTLAAARLVSTSSQSFVAFSSGAAAAAVATPAVAAAPAVAAGGGMDAVAIKAHFSTQAVTGCYAPDGTVLPVGRPMNHSPPLIFDLARDPAEASPLVNVSTELINHLNALHKAKIDDIASTFRSVADYSQGGDEARPCCNRASPYCACTV